MTGGPLETLDSDVFYNTEEFAVNALILGETVAGLYDRQEIQDEERLGEQPMFRCWPRFDEGTVIEILGEVFEIQAVLPLESGEFAHYLQISD